MSSNRTRVPGMEDVFESQTQEGAQFSGETSIPFVENGINKEQGVSQKPIMGVLYSISKSRIGELWPLRVGPNVIGRNSNCDVQLCETTVSGEHAVLVIRQMNNPDRVIASICDSRSTCGTLINGESLGFEAKECVSGDIITIGEHYELLLLLIDAKQLGLNVCPEFLKIDDNRRANPYMGHTMDNNTKYGPSRTRWSSDDSTKSNNSNFENSHGTIFL